MRRTAPALIAAMVAVVVAANPARAKAQPLPAGGGPAVAGAAHGWVVLPGLDEGWTLVHLPPRGADPATAMPGAATGTARVVSRLTDPPEAITVVGGRAYLVFAPKQPAPDEPAQGPQHGRMVLSISASATGLAGLWQYDPVGRLRPHRSLDATGDLLGLAPTPVGPMALVDPPDPGGRDQLLVLSDGAWLPMDLPAQAGPTDRPARLIAWGSGVAMLIESGGGVELWIGEVSTEWIDPPPHDDPPTIERPDQIGGPPADALADEPTPRRRVWVSWQRKPTAITSALLDSAAGPGRVFEMLGELVVVQEAASTLTLRTVGEQRAMLLARVEGVGERCGVVPLRDSDRIAVVWTESDATLRTVLVEVSAATGRVLYRDQADFTGPISPGEFRVLALAMVGLTMLVLVYLLRGGSGDEAIVLPVGWSLIAPGRRLTAAVIDLLVAASVAGAALGISVFEALSLDPLGGDALESWGLGVTLAAGMVLSIVCEAVWGRTLGKWLVGARVTRQGARVRRPTPFGAIVRNACKWLLPPLSVLALWDPNGRHRGDVLARTLVVVPIDPVDDPEPSASASSDAD